MKAESKQVCFDLSWCFGCSFVPRYLVRRDDISEINFCRLLSDIESTSYNFCPSAENSFQKLFHHLKLSC